MPSGGFAVPVRRRHSGAALVAVGLSLVLHAVLLTELPPLPLGRVFDQQPWPDYPAIELGEVLRTPRMETRQPARFRPENPEDVAQAYGEPDLGSALTDRPLPIPEAPDISTGPLQGESQALAEPGALPERRAWDPREEILQIDRQVLDEQVSALPRRFVDSVQRTDRVPDVVLPVEQPADLVAALQGEGPVGIESASRPTVRDQGVLGDAGLPPVTRMGMPTGDLLQQATEMLAPPEEQPSGMDPVDEYLQLAVHSFRATDEQGALYFQLDIRRAGEAALPVLPKDVLLLQDASESMTPWKLAECKRGLRRWLDTLAPQDRFEIIGFRDTVERCFGTWTPLTPETRARALQFIDNLRAVGNTDVYASLAAALEAPREAGRAVLAVLVTDGRPTAGVTGSSDIIERFSHANEGAMSMFALGSGRKANRFLLDLLSFRNRGDSLVVTDDAELTRAMERWSQEIRRPVLTDLSYRFTGVEGADVYPATLTHLYLDRPLVLYGRVERAPARAAFQVVGRSGSAVRDLVFPLDLASAQPGTDAIRRAWAWQRVYHWIGAYTQSQDPALLAELRAFADRYGLVVPYGYGTFVPRE